MTKPPAEHQEGVSSDQENRLKAMFETVVDGIVTIDDQGIVESINPSAQSLFGYTAAEVVGNNVSMLMGEPHRTRHDAYLERYLSTSERRVIGIGREVQGRRKDGSLFDMELAVSEMSVAGRRMFTGVIRDISERSGRRRLLDAITSAQQEMSLQGDPRRIFDKLLDELLTLTQSEYGFIGEVHYDEENVPYLTTRAITNIAWNEETRRFYEDNAPDGLEFRNIDNLFGAVLTSRKPVLTNTPSLDSRSGGLPEGHPPLNAFLGLPFFSREQFVGMVGIANRPGGYDKELIDFLHPFLLTCSNLIVTLRTESARAEVEITLREREARGRAILHGAIEAIITINEQGLIEEINPATEKVFGYMQEELRGRNVNMLMPEPFRSHHDGYIRHYLDTSIPKIIGSGREVVGQRKDGSTFPMELAVNHITVGGRNMFTGVIRDITEQKRSAEQLRQLNVDLSERVRELDALNEVNLLLNDMSSYFQSAESLEELDQILMKYCAPLFDQEVGGYFRLEDNKVVELSAKWGGEFTAATDFQLGDCWALRRSEPKVVQGENEPLICQHLKGISLTHSVCVPVSGRDGAIGLLSVYTAEDGTASEHRTERNLRLLDAIGDRLGTAISNIKLRQRLHMESIRDPLTKLYNRRFFKEASELEMRRAHRQNKPLSIVVIDADHFKRFNDEYGHEAGDEVLRTLAEIIQANCRNEDIPCRYGGEEFALMITNVNREFAVKRAEVIRKAVETTEVLYNGTPLPRITISCGVASIPEDAEDQSTCFTRADEALYVAKNDGRNRVATPD